MRALLRVSLILLTALGVVFMGQGVGLIPGSFMTGRIEWAVIGTALAGVGVMALWWTFRPRGSSRM